MAKHLLINVVPWEARVALLEDTTLVELHIERGRQRGIAGNVYKGKVVRVLPGMQAAFVDIGLEKAAFLHVSDMPGEEELPATLTQEGDVEAADVAPVVARDARPIEERLQKGQEVLVQVAKEPMGTKGARVTSHVSLPGRYLVCMPGTRHIGISRRIEDAAERERLRGIVEAEGTPDAGFIVRTACEGVTKREIHDDVRFLTRLWARVEKAAAAVSCFCTRAQRRVRKRTSSWISRLVTSSHAVRTMNPPSGGRSASMIARSRSRSVASSIRREMPMCRVPGIRTR